MEMMAKGVDDHIVGIDLAIGRIACYMWRTNANALQKLKVELGFVLPNIKHRISNSSVTESGKEGLVINNFTTAGIDDVGTVLQAMEEGLVSKVIGRMATVAGKRNVEGDDVTLAFDDIHRDVGVGCWVLGVG